MSNQPDNDIYEYTRGNPNMTLPNRRPKLATDYNVLIIEDDLDLSGLLQDFFVETGYTVTVENDGEKAISTLRRVRPDVVLLDMYLGDSHGLKILDQILHPKPVILAMTGDRDISGRDIFEKKVHGLFRKPFNTQDLIAAAERFIPFNREFNEKSPCAKLSTREREIMSLICRGDSTKEIGRQLNISHRTVEKHRENIKTKFGGAAIIEIRQIINQYFIEQA